MRRPAKGENSLNELLIVAAILGAPRIQKPERVCFTHTPRKERRISVKRRTLSQLRT
jgi:hypothetical protein